MIGSGIAIAGLWMVTLTLFIFGAINLRFQRYAMGGFAMALGVCGGIVGKGATDALIEAERALLIAEKNTQQDT